MNASSLNMDTLMDASGGDRDTAIELIQLFAEVTGPEFARLEQAADDGDPDTLAATAHKCAGSCGACGMMLLCQQLRTLEAVAANGIPEDAEQQLAAIRLEKARVRQLLDTHFNRHFDL